MADLRISDLPADTTAADDDVFPFTSTQGSQTRKIRADLLGLALARLGLRVGSSIPSSPAPANGDLWVDTTTNPPVLKIYNGASFTTVSFLPGSSVATSPGATAPSSPALGQLWQDTSQTPDELKMFDGANFVRVDPLGITQAAGDLRYLQLTDAATTYLALAGGTLTGNLTLNGDPSTTNMAANKNYVDTQIAAIPSVDPVPPGTIIWTARDTAPDGYLVADDTAYSRTTYAALFAAIGTRYGAGDGSTTFNLPDLRGQFVRGIDEPIGLNNPRGKDSGRQMGSDQGDQNKQHNHTITGGTLSYVSNVTLNEDINSVPNSPDEVNVHNEDTTVERKHAQPTLRCWAVLRLEATLNSKHRRIHHGHH
jgi:microcystin-dependent protein